MVADNPWKLSSMGNLGKLWGGGDRRIQRLSAHFETPLVHRCCKCTLGYPRICRISEKRKCWCVQTLTNVLSTHFKKSGEMVSKASTLSTQKNMAPKTRTRSRSPARPTNIPPVSEWIYEATDIASVWSVKHKGVAVDLIVADTYSSFDLSSMKEGGNRKTLALRLPKASDEPFDCM